MHNNNSKGKKTKALRLPPSQRGLRKQLDAKQVPVTSIQDLDQTSEEDQASDQDVVSQKLDIMMNMLIDLSRRIQATEDHQREMAASPAASPPTSHPGRRRARRHQPWPTEERDLPRKVRQMVAKRLRQYPIITVPITDEEATSEEKQPASWHQRPMRSGLQCTGGSMVMKQVTWLPAVVYFAVGKPAVY